MIVLLNQRDPIYKMDDEMGIKWGDGNGMFCLTGQD